MTNQIYVACQGASAVTVIDGATNATQTVAAGMAPSAVAVNTVTNTVYVANFDDNTVTVINGTTNATSTVDVGNGPVDIAVNPVTNMIYVANLEENDTGGSAGWVSSFTSIADLRN